MRSIDPIFLKLTMHYSTLYFTTTLQYENWSGGISTRILAGQPHISVCQLYLFPLNKFASELMH